MYGRFLDTIPIDELGSSTNSQRTRNAERILCTDLSDHIEAVMGLF